MLLVFFECIKIFSVIGKNVSMVTMTYGLMRMMPKPILSSMWDRAPEIAKKKQNHCISDH